MMEDALNRWPRPLVVAGVGAALLAGGAAWLWIERTPIATSYIDDMLKARGVPASYRLTRIGFRTQRIEGIRIGDAARPDLTAEWAEIELSVGLFGVGVKAIDAGGVRLRGRLVDGKLSLGAIDRLLPVTKQDQPFALPRIGLTARAVRVELATPQGLVHAVLDGRGNLDDGFRGSLGVMSDRLTAGGCGVSAPRAQLAVAIQGGRPQIRGPVEAASIACSSAKIAAPRINIDARGDADLMRWRGKLAIARGSLVAGRLGIGTLGGETGFDASARRVAGKGRLVAHRIRHDGASIGRAVVVAAYRFDPRAGDGVVDGEARISAARLDSAAADRLARQIATGDGTPLGPILLAWSRAVRQASRNVDASARFAISHGSTGGGARIDRLEAAAFGGGRLLIRGEQAEGLGWRWPKAGPVINASAELSGGGFPKVLMSLRQAVPGAPLTGSATVAPYQAGDARLRLTPFHFASDNSGRTVMSTRAMLDGPLADGRIEGLDLPISAIIGRGGAFAVNPGCAALGFERLVIAGTVVAPTRLPLCPIDGALIGRSSSGRLFGGARIATPRLRGRIGERPLTLAARSLTIGVGRPGFQLDMLAVRLGDPAEQSRLDVARLEGAVGAQGLSGRFQSAVGKIAVVPLLIGDGEGTWRLASSVLTLDGGISLADAETMAPRFHPLIAKDVHLTLKDGRIAATATLREPRSAVPVSRVAIRHDLSNATGDARLDVDDLRFGKALQPEAITPLTLGMIANVEGALAGQGRIKWANGVVTSDGEFRTDGINLAAAFGPVTGLKGVIRFTDMLGMVTAPDQQVTIAEINPGVAVTEGVIRYRILPDHKLAVSEGLWPFAGGTLKLEPTVFDMGQPVARRLTFRITALDAATFIQQLQFKNIAVTGTFDGVLPIIFDAQGGRIEGGVLTVRPGGGTLSYVGDVTNAELGPAARVAFDALKSMRYDKLTIELNGSLDGEIVSRVRFDGTNDKPEETAKAGGIVGRVLAPITRLPFRFNITVTAPFRGLVNSAQTFVDPSVVLRSSAFEAAPPPAAPPVPTSPPIQAP